MSLSLASAVTEGARLFPGEVAQIDGEKRWTYGDLADRVLRVAGYLASKGIGRGDKVALMSCNLPEFTVCYYGILASGATVVSLNTLLVADEVQYQLENSEAVAVLAEAESLPTVLEAVDRAECAKWVALVNPTRPANLAEAKDLPCLEDILSQGPRLDRHELTYPDDTAVVMYTSGTTGHPKGAELTHYNLWENARQVSERLFADKPTEIRLIGPGHVALAVLPLYHSFGQTCVQNAMLLNGAAISYQKRFDPEETSKIIARDRVTILDAVPTIYNALLHCQAIDPRNLQCLQYGVSGGAALPIEVRNAFEDRFKMELQEGYGLTETSPVASAQVLWKKRKIGSIGVAIPGVEMKIFDDEDREVAPGTPGEVVIRGRNIMKGYLKQPEATAAVMQSGWFHTGDIGTMDEEGDFYIVDRKKDMIIRGGYNVYPREVEEVLYSHPDVEEASVFGVPHDHYGEEVKAVVRIKAGSSADPAILIEYCKKHIAAYKYPRFVEVIDELPKGPTGKILKREIREKYS